MIAKPRLPLVMCGVAAWIISAAPITGRAAEIRDGAPEARAVTARRTASLKDAEFRVEIKATEKDGKLGGAGRLFFKWASPGKGGDVVAEIDADVGVEGSFDGGRVRLRIAGPPQFQYVVKQAPPPDPQVPLKDQVHVGSTGEYPLSVFDAWNVIEGTLVNGHYEHKGPQTLPAGVWLVATEISLVGLALVDRLTVGGRVEAGDVFSVAVGETNVLISAARPTPDAVAEQLAAAWARSGERTGIVAAANGPDVWLTAADPKNAFTCKINATEADGKRSDGQTFSSSTQFIAGGPEQELWKKEVRHCGRLVATLYAREPSPAVGYFGSFLCPICRQKASGGEWTKVR